MNTIEIYNKLKPLCESFIDVYPSDRIPKAKRRGWMVINIDPSHKKGSHWVVAGCGEYFDPMGFPPLNLTVIDYLNLCSSKWWFNTFPLQKYGTTVCGQFCVFYVLKRCSGYTPSQIVTDLRKLPNSGKYVYQYVNKL